jgi:hypothetical protein
MRSAGCAINSTVSRSATRIRSSSGSIPKRSSKTRTCRFPGDTPSPRAARRNHGRGNPRRRLARRRGERFGRTSDKQMHRAGGAFVHRLRELSASALRLPRTAPKGDFDLIALRARCRTNLRHRALRCNREPTKDHVCAIHNLKASLARRRAVRSRACCVTQEPMGFFLQAASQTRRLPWLMKKSA